MQNISVILLAGGKGYRMASALPKQFLHLDGKPIVLHSLEIFLDHPEVEEVIVVCAESYRDYFSDFPVLFAQPGERRQDSLYNGLQKAKHQWICVHDAARPFISQKLLSTLFEEGRKTKAATLGVPVKWTVKETDQKGYVKKTLDRDVLWEIQTPQFLCKELLEKGFKYAHEHQLTVTDDVVLAELIDHPVKIVMGGYENLKITTPEDLIIAKHLNPIAK